MSKIARAILTHRQELIPELKRYYLDSGKTQNLIIAYNQVSVDPKGLAQSENFRLFPYLGKGPGGSIFGQMFLVWSDLAKNFPEIETWIIHDYDVIVKPKDSDLSSKIGPNEYGMVGVPFYYSKQTIENSSNQNLYPFYKSELRLSLGNSNYRAIEDHLLKTYPVKQNGRDIVLTGYGDLIVAHRDHLILLGAENLRSIANGGNEQVPHTVLAHFGVKPVDLKEYFKCFISLDNTVYGKFNSQYELAHPVKFWPGFPGPKLILSLKRFIKILIRPGFYRHMGKKT